MKGKPIKDSVIFSVRMSKELYSPLNQMANKAGWSIAEVVRDVLKIAFGRPIADGHSSFYKNKLALKDKPIKES